MMRGICLLTLILLFVYGCDSRRVHIRQILEEFEQAQIAIPDDMTMICDGKLMPSQIKDSIASFVVYVSPEECSDCRIAHLGDYSMFFEWSNRSGSFQTLIVFSPYPEEIDSVLETIIASGFSYPVYLDTNLSFSENSIPYDILTHSFLLNKSGKPILIGDPTRNDRLLKLYESQLLN